MHRRQVLKLFAGFALCPLCGPRSFAADVHWSYEGRDGPAKWGDLDAVNRACSIGGEQSPIDIREPIKAQLAPLNITWAKTVDTIINNGHTIQVNIDDSSVLSVGAGRNYRLLQFHFHHPSEHLIDGKSFPMEVHFVHANAAGSLAVVGVLMTTGRPNAVFNKIVSTMPEQEGPAVKADPAINPNGLLPPARLLPLFWIAHHAALQRDRRLACLDRPDPGGGCRCRPLRQALSDGCASGAEDEPPLRTAVDIAWPERRERHKRDRRAADAGPAKTVRIVRPVCAPSGVASRKMCSTVQVPTARTMSVDPVAISRT